MARTSGAMITWNDMDDMVTFDGFQYQLDAPAEPANMDKCATKTEIEQYLISFISGGTYSSNQLVPYQKIFRGFAVNPLTLTYGETAAIQGINISTPNGWTASEGVTWLTLSSTSGTGDATISATTTTNLDIARSTTIAITDTTTTEVINVTVNQDAATGIATDPIDLAVGVENAAAACAVIKGEYETVYIPTGEVFATCTHLYNNALGTISSGSGWYSDGDVSREWNGSTAFIGSNYTC